MNDKSKSSGALASISTSAGVGGLLRLIQEPAPQLGLDERCVIVTGKGPQSEAHTELSTFGGLFKPKRRYIVRSSMRDTGPNVVQWKVHSRTRHDQPLGGTRVPVNVSAWCPPGSETTFARFFARNERLIETLDRDIESAFIRALDEATSKLGDALQGDPERPTGSASPQEFGRSFRRQLESSLLAKMPLKDYGLEFRFFVELPEIEPAFTGQYCVPMDLKGSMKIVLKSKVLLQMAGPAGLITFIESDVKKIDAWCAAAVNEVIAHEMFADDLLRFLSEFEQTKVRTIEAQLRKRAKSVGYNLKNLISQPLLNDENGKVPEAFLFLKNLTLEGSGDFESEDPGITVPLRFSIQCKLGSLDNRRVRDALDCGRNLKDEIKREIMEIITRIVRDRTPNEAFLQFETAKDSGKKPLKLVLCEAIANVCLRYGARGLEDAAPLIADDGAEHQNLYKNPDYNLLIRSIDLSVRTNNVSDLWRALNYLEFHIAADYQSPDNPLLAGARLIGRFRVTAITKSESPNVGFLTFMRFARRREDYSMDFNVEGAAQFIHTSTSEYMRSKLCAMDQQKFIQVLKALRRDVGRFSHAGVENVLSETDPKDPKTEFEETFEDWANEFCSLQYGMGVTLIYCNAELNENLQKHLQKDAETALDVRNKQRDYLVERIDKIYKQLANDSEMLNSDDRQKLMDEANNLKNNLDQLDRRPRSLGNGTANGNSGAGEKSPGPGGDYVEV